MATQQRPKASDRQAILQKIVPILKKHYKASPPPERSVLDTMLYAICVENATDEQAIAALERLGTVFHDLNEVRVSTITELNVVFDGVPAGEMRALRLRSGLQFVFEKNFAFDYESLRKKPPEAAIKQLGRIRDLSSFVRQSVLQVATGGHVIPLDDATARAAVWLGLLDPGLSIDDASEALKPVIRKADVAVALHLLRCLATDPKLAPAFDVAECPPPDEGWDLDTAPQRLAALLEKGPQRSKPKKVVAPPAKKLAAADKPPGGAAKKKAVEKPASAKTAHPKSAATTPAKSKKKTTARRG